MSSWEKIFLSIALYIPTAHDFAIISARTRRVHRHSARDFPRAKLDSETNACFLLNKHGGLYFLLHNFGVQIILFKLKSYEK